MYHPRSIHTISVEGLLTSFIRLGGDVWKRGELKGSHGDLVFIAITVYALFSVIDVRNQFVVVDEYSQNHSESSAL